MKTLRVRIRAIVDAAERRLAQPEIYAPLLGGGRVGRNTFCVEIARMVGARQLSRRRATKDVRALFPKTRFVYGPGPVPVEDASVGERAPRKVLGFMAAKRMREAKARRARA